MTFKTPPRVCRAQRMKDWLSRGTYEKNWAQKLKEDFEVRQLIFNTFGKKSLIEKVEIERVGEKITIIIFTAKPGFVIGQKGEMVERIREKIRNKIFKGEKEIYLEIRETSLPWVSASIVAQWVALQLEKRMPYRKVIKHALNKVMANKQVKGAKIQVAGRLDGVEIARTEWVKKGRLPRITLRSDIDFACEDAKTKVGIVGVKVWIYKGEKEE